MDGFLCVNKPRGPSSFQIIDQLRRILHIKKIGHAGTLDPQASGLLLIAVGKATRLLQYIPAEPKTYQFGIQFGSQTDTLDSEGKTVLSGGIIPDQVSLGSILKKYCGKIMQVPPAYSAIRINGQRAYKMARCGIEPVLHPREIEIYSIELLKYDQMLGEAQIQVTCSGGTYVRSLARDISADLGTYGFASFVHRVGIGVFTIDNAVSADQLDDAERSIIPLKNIFTKNVLHITEEQKIDVLYGKDLVLSDVDTDRIFAFCGEEFVAVLNRITVSLFHPATVLTGS